MTAEEGGLGNRSSTQKCVFVYTCCAHVCFHILYMSLRNLGGGIIANFSPRTQSLSPSLHPWISIHPLQVQRVTRWWDESWRLRSLVEVLCHQPRQPSPLCMCAVIVCVCMYWAGFFCAYVFMRLFLSLENHAKPLWFHFNFEHSSLPGALPADHAHE